MSSDPDDDQPSDDPEDVRREGDRKLDEDAAWRSIIEHYGDRAELDEDPPPPPPVDLPEPQRFTIFDRRWEGPPEPEPAWEHEDHFVPPEPPPLPVLEPRRRLAWLGLFGSPAMMLLAVIFGWTYAAWFAFLLVGAFVGGFGYLIFTMPRTGDDSSGDNGAVV